MSCTMARRPTTTPSDSTGCRATCSLPLGWSITRVMGVAGASSPGQATWPGKLGVACESWPLSEQYANAYTRWSLSTLLKYCCIFGREPSRTRSNTLSRMVLAMSAVRMSMSRTNQRSMRSSTSGATCQAMTPNATAKGRMKRSESRMYLALLLRTHRRASPAQWVCCGPGNRAGRRRATRDNAAASGMRGWLALCACMPQCHKTAPACGVRGAQDL